MFNNKRNNCVNICLLKNKIKIFDIYIFLYKYREDYYYYYHIKKKIRDKICPLLFLARSVIDNQFTVFVQ